jgi:hypothetical protein
VKRRTTCTDVWEKGLSPSLVPALRSHSPNSNRQHRSRQNRTTVEGGEKTAETLSGDDVARPLNVAARYATARQGGFGVALEAIESSLPYISTRDLYTTTCTPRGHRKSVVRDPSATSGRNAAAI